ncbi:UPF0329 protein [Dirofilaria immitis]
MSEEHCNATTFQLKKYLYMPPQKSLIAELLKKQTKMEQAELETSISLHKRESSYINLDLQIGDNFQLSRSTIPTFSSIIDQSFTSAQNIQKNTYQHSSSNTSITSHDSLEFSDSGSAELPTGVSHDSLNSHDAFEIFAWNQKKKWENPEETSTFETRSEYCYCLNSSQPY